MRILNLKESSNIKAAYFTKRDGYLVVDFHGGQTYEYFGVSPLAVKYWEESESVGKGFHLYIKSAGFEYNKVEPRKEVAV